MAVCRVRRVKAAATSTSLRRSSGEQEAKVYALALPYTYILTRHIRGGNVDAAKDHWNRLRGKTLLRTRSPAEAESFLRRLFLLALQFSSR